MENEIRKILGICTEEQINLILPALLDLIESQNITECENCGEMVNMIITGELCPKCYC